MQIQFYGSDGVLEQPLRSPCAAGAQSILTDVVGQLGGSGSGALEIVSDQPLEVTARSYNQVAADASCYPDGTQGQDYPAVLASGGLSAGQSAYLAGLTENASYRCNIGLVNTGTASATVLVGLFNGAGTQIGSYTVPLTAGQWAQATQPFLNEAGADGDGRGYADDHGAVGVGGVRLRLGDRQHHQRPDHGRDAAVGTTQGARAPGPRVAGPRCRQRPTGAPARATRRGRGRVPSPGAGSTLDPSSDLRYSTFANK